MIMALPAIAEYKPPKKRSAPSGPITSTGTRSGCSGQSQTSLTALAPLQHVGQTVSSHPSFVWYVPDQEPRLLTFQLYQLSPAGKQLVYSTQLQSSPGLMQMTLPKDQSGLSVNQRYSWQAVLFCDPNRPSTALLAGAEIDVVNMPASLSQVLASTQTPAERAQHYADAGFWYDALYEVSQLPSGKLSEQQAALLQDLATLETAEGDNAVESQGQRLQQILAAELLSQN